MYIEDKLQVKTKYKVQRWIQKIDGGTEENESNYKLWDTVEYDDVDVDTEVEPNVIPIHGFTEPGKQKVEVARDGSTVVKYYFTRNSYKLTLIKGEGIASVIGEGTYKYEEVVGINAVASAGYTWSKWTGLGAPKTQNGVVQMQGDITLTAEAVPSTNTKYTIWHCRQGLDGTYPSNLIEEEILYGTTGTTVTPEFKEYEGFSPKGRPISVEIKGNGSTLIEYSYERLAYNVTVNKGTGIASVSGGGKYKYGQKVTIKAKVEQGYTWSKWTGTLSSTTQEYSFTMPASGVNLTANATANTNTKYTIKHWGGTNGNYDLLLEEEILYGTTGTTVTPKFKEYKGFVPNGSTQSVKIEGDGKTLVEYYYDATRLYLYDKGNQCTSVTGGWQGKAVKPTWADDPWCIPVKPAVNFEKSTMRASLDSEQNYRYGNLETKKDINLTGYNYLVVEFESINTVGMYSGVVIGVGPRATTETYKNAAWADAVPGGDNSVTSKKVSVDISSLNKQYDVYISLYAQRCNISSPCLFNCSNKSNIFRTIEKNEL